ncbi:hypothetical protein ABT288_40730 [Streptomyces sp. NPDC001093]|uniref:hypothetical protein n=1 Tax=Streptomyces sp. NPDC001093 TaxID=3154376 RepID=UPI0033223184
MTTATELAPDVKLTHAAGLTEADLDEWDRFIKDRLNAMQGAHPYDSDEWRAGGALKTALRRLVEPVRASFRYDDGTPELLLARMRHWIRLQSIADRWGDADGYDRDRWSCLFRLDAADEELSAEYARRCEAEQAACERDRLLRIL